MDNISRDDDLTSKNEKWSGDWKLDVHICTRAPKKEKESYVSSLKFDQIRNSIH